MSAFALEFHESDPSGAIDALARTQGGWVNLQPGVREEDEPPPRSPFSGLLTARGPDVPIATWVPGERSAGIQHATGPKAARTLASAGVPVPDGWRVVQDHPRRGLVVVVPDAVDDATVVGWLLRATRTLCPVDITADWLATIYAP